MPHCVACAIATGLLEARVVFENEHNVCFLDHMPINEGHILPREWKTSCGTQSNG